MGSIGDSKDYPFGSLVCYRLGVTALGANWLARVRRLKLGQTTLGVCVATSLLLGTACNKRAKYSAKEVAAASEQFQSAKVDQPTAVPSFDSFPDTQPELVVGVDEPAELSAIKVRVVQGDRSVRTLKELQKLSYRFPKNAEVAYILGHFYCEKLWMVDGLAYFRRAIQLQNTYRTSPYLIKAVVAGLGNDSDHSKVEHFLVQEIGQPAAPFLEDVLDGSWRQQVKDRAADILRKIK